MVPTPQADNRSLLRLLLSSDHSSPTLLLAQLSLSFLALLNLGALFFSWYALPIFFATVFLFLFFVLLNLFYVFILEALGCVQDTISDQWEIVGKPLGAMEEKLEKIDLDLDDIYHYTAETYGLVRDREERQKFVTKSKRKPSPQTVVLETIHTDPLEVTYESA